jgi:hypothetical protein
VAQRPVTIPDATFKKENRDEDRPAAPPQPSSLRAHACGVLGMLAVFTSEA